MSMIPSDAFFVQRMKDSRLIYWRWTWAFRDHVSLCVLLQTIMTASLQQRKELLGLARTQSPVLSGSYLASTLTCEYDTILVPLSIVRLQTEVRYTTMTLGALVSLYQDAFLDPIPASLIALATRISPNTTNEEYTECLQAAVFKELTAAVNRFRGARFNYDCIFSSDPRHRSIPFSSRVVDNPEVASDTYRIFCRLRETLSNRICFPSTGRKTVGRVVEQNFWSAYRQAGCHFKHDGRFGDPSQITPLDCLKLYSETGGYVDGPVEVRSAWKYTQIAPRIYYARGGSVLSTSQYLQPILNMIIDAFPEVHRHNRFSSPHDPLTDTDVEIIYDYSSFTSMLDDVVEFVRYLSIFFTGTRMTLIDVYHGPVDIDLGDLFARYNKECNDYVEFDASRVSSAKDDLTVLTHTCGMLGVEANIFLATLLHGIHLRFIAGLNRSRCVGDDARFHHGTEDGTLSQDEKSRVAWMLSGLGVINESKLGIFENGVEPELQAYRYIKRPLQRDRDIMLEGLMIDLPSLIPLTALSDRYHTVLPSNTHPCRVTFKAIVRLLRTLKLHSLSMDSDEEGVRMLARHVQFLVGEIRKQDPDGKHSPFGKSDIQTGYRLPQVSDWGKIDYEDWILHGLGYETEVRFLQKGGSNDEICDGRIGSTMIRESSGRRSFLVKMGYLRREDLFDVVSISMIGLDGMKEYLDGLYPAVCRYVVVESVPSWYSQIPSTL